MKEQFERGLGPFRYKGRIRMMKNLKRKHNIYGAVTFFCLFVMLGAAGGSDTGCLGDSPLFPVMIVILLGTAILSACLFRATGVALSRKRIKMAEFYSEQRDSSSNQVA